MKGATHLILLAREIVVRRDGTLDARVDVGVPRVVGAVDTVRVAGRIGDVEVDLAVFAALVGRHAGSDRGGEILAEVC